MKSQKSPRRTHRPSAGGDPAFQLLFLSHPDPMCICEPRTLSVLDVNEAAVRFTGYPRDALVGHGHTALRCVAHAADRRRYLAALRADGRVAGMEAEFRTRAGESRSGVLSGEPVDVAGQPRILSAVRATTGSHPAMPAFEAARARLARALRLARVGFLDWDLETNELYLSDETCELTGFRPESRLTTPDFMFRVVHPDDRAFTEERLSLAVKGIEPYDVSFRLVRPDGRIVWVHGQAELERDADGAPARLFGTMVDITELKRAELALGLKNVQLSAQQEASLDGILVVDEHGTILSFNQRFVELWGVPPEVAASRSDARSLQFALARVVDPVGFVARVRYLYEHREEKSEEEIALLDGRTFDRYSAPMFGADGAYHGRVWYFRDITRRKQAEEALRESQERLQRAVSAGDVGLFDWDLRTNEVHYSPEWKRQIGYAEHEIANSYDEWRSRVHPDDLEHADRDEKASLTAPWPDYRAEYRLRHRDGSYRRILARGSVLRDESGTPARMLGSHIDITEHAQLQDQFLQAQKMESVGRLAGGIAHDFNNLLTVIASYTELALGALKGDEPLREDLEQISAAAVRAAELTRRLLAFSRKQVLQVAVLDLNALLTSMEKMVRRLIGEDLELTLLPARHLGSVRADPGQLEQVIVNLVVNARDAMPSGGRLTIATSDVELDEAYASRHAGARPGPYVLLAVTDTGTGMDDATLSRIFEPFFTTKEAGRGTGLGLSTVYGIAQQSGGHVWVRSEVGAGTTFEIYLPRVAEPPADVKAVPASGPTRGTETVLVVEDEANLGRAVRRILSTAGYTVLAAADGMEALRTLAAHEGPLHLLLTDVVMPGLSGRDVAERIGTLSPGTRVLFSSGYPDDAVLSRGVVDASVHFIAKPYTPQALLQKVREVLDAPA